MIKVLMLLLISYVVCAEEYFKVPYLGVYDGDTIYTEVKLPGKLSEVSIRLYGIDTPERSYRSGCDIESTKAEDAKKYLENMLTNVKYLYLRDYDWDKYGGRILAKAYYKKKIDGKYIYVNISHAMQVGGYAIEYYGEKKTFDWCK